MTNQKENFDLKAFLPYLLTQAAEESSLAFQQVYKDRYGMLRTEWRVLFHLGLYGSMTAGEIVTVSSTHKTKISRAVRRLEERRFLRRDKDTGDRRVEHLSLTNAGRAAYTDLRQIAQEYDAGLAQQLTPAELNVLHSALRKLANIDAPPFT